VEQSDGAREESEEVMTKSRMSLFVGEKIHMLTDVKKGQKR